MESILPVCTRCCGSVSQPWSLIGHHRPVWLDIVEHRLDKVHHLIGQSCTLWLTVATYQVRLWFARITSFHFNGRCFCPSLYNQCCGFDCFFVGEYNKGWLKHTHTHRLQRMLLAHLKRVLTRICPCSYKRKKTAHTIFQSMGALILLTDGKRSSDLYTCWFKLRIKGYRSEL